MPLINDQSVDKPSDVPRRVGEIQLAKLLKDLAMLASDTTSYMWQKAIPESRTCPLTWWASLDSSLSQAGLWYHQMSGHLSICTPSQSSSSPSRDRDWGKLRHHLWTWLDIKKRTLEYARNMLQVPVIDIASEVVGS